MPVLLRHGIDRCQVTGIGELSSEHRPQVIVLGPVMVIELSPEGDPAGQHGRRRARRAVKLRGRIPQPRQIAAQRRVQGAHEAGVGWCVRLAQTAAGSQADHGPNDQRCPGYRGQNPATTPCDHA